MKPKNTKFQNENGKKGKSITTPSVGQGLFDPATNHHGLLPHNLSMQSENETNGNTLARFRRFSFFFQDVNEFERVHQRQR
jgi:hypothetical protein